MIKNYIEEYNCVLDYCLLHDLVDIPFKEKTYLFTNNITKIPTCKNCKKRVNFINTTIGYRDYCSTKCISTDPQIKKMKEENSIIKFGTKSPSQSQEVKEKSKQTNLEKYGHISAMCLLETQEKSKQTLFKNHGVYNTSQSDILSNKRIESFKLSNYRETYKKKSIEKYGVNHPWMNKDIHSKSIEKTIITKNKNIYNSISEKLKSYSQYDLISVDYNKYKREIKIYCKNCNSEFLINREDLHIRHINKSTICMNCNPINSSKSGSELEMLEFIRSIFTGNIITNSRSIITPFELDIYLPDINIAFEFNGLYWHSEGQKGKMYHYNKTKFCKINNIELVHIWEDDWMYRNKIVKSIIRNKIGVINNRIFARKCIIKEIENNVDKDFLENNHILGSCNSNIKIGLYYKNQIVSLMCFLKIGNSYELTRYCNIIDNIITGASSKIYSYFVKKYKPNEVISYSDESMFSGYVYEKLGFDFIGYSNVNYKWVINRKREHKSKYRKDRLIKSGYDPNKSESDIMIEDVGSYKVWDCGLKKWKYTPKS